MNTQNKLTRAYSPYTKAKKHHITPLFVSKNRKNKVLVMKQIFDESNEDIMDIDVIHDRINDSHEINYHLSEIEAIEDEDELYFV